MVDKTVNAAANGYDPLFPIAFVLGVDSELLAVSRFPIAQVGFEDHVSSLEHPAQLSLIFEPYP
jgi:hypothetical protein